MKINGIKNISKTIYLLDKNITELLLQKVVNVNQVDVLSSIRQLYIEELNGLIRVRNTREMFK